MSGRNVALGNTQLQVYHTLLSCPVGFEVTFARISIPDPAGSANDGSLTQPKLHSTPLRSAGALPHAPLISIFRARMPRDTFCRQIWPV